MRGIRTVLLCLSVSIPTICAFAQDADKVLAAALKKQADAWDVAIVKKDKKAIEDNMSESFFMIDSGGGTSDKAKFVADLTAPDITIEPYTSKSASTATRRSSTARPTCTVWKTASRSRRTTASPIRT